MFKNTILFLTLFAFTHQVCFTQNATNSNKLVTTAVPFLNVCTDARSTSLGMTGAATLPDIYSQNQNPAKYAFFYSKKDVLREWRYRYLYYQDTCDLELDYKNFVNNIQRNNNIPDFNCIDNSSISENINVAISFSPLLQNIHSGANIGSIFVVKRLNRHQSVSTSVRFLSYGNVYFVSDNAEVIRIQNPFEFAIDMAYTRLLSEHFSGAVALKYIHSDLTGGQMVNGVESHAVNSYAADIAFYFQNKFMVNRKESIFSAGIYISNIGAKISYTEGVEKDFIPANLKLGFSLSKNLGRLNSISFSVDANKLLVPIVEEQEDYNFEYTGNHDNVINSIINSFSDAPGGFKEELQEITLSCGIEYSLRQIIHLRTGFFYEDIHKGTRKFFSSGLGFNISFNRMIMQIDASLIKTIEKNHPMNNTKQLSISFAI